MRYGTKPNTLSISKDKANRHTLTYALGTPYKYKHYTTDMTTRLIVLLLALLPTASAILAQPSSAKRYILEATSADTQLIVRGDTAELYSPEGATLWLDTLLAGDSIVVEYEAQVVVKDSKRDRLSDLNCFFMASEKDGSSVLSKADERQGIFANCYSMQLYYVGYGGNWNTTTRMRRYDGQGTPPIAAEYTDELHLLKANRWYKVRLSLIGNVFTYDMDGERLFTYHDVAPLRQGHFGFRTTKSHTMIRHVTINSHTL